MKLTCLFLFCLGLFVNRNSFSQRNISLKLEELSSKKEKCEFVLPFEYYNCLKYNQH